MESRIEKHNSTQKSPRPEVVPPLKLEGLVVDVPEDKVLEKPIPSRNALTSPSSRSVVSWGTPSSTPYALTTQDKELGGTVHRPCTHKRHRQVEPQRNPITHTKPVVHNQSKFQSNNTREAAPKQRNPNTEPKQVTIVQSPKKAEKELEQKPEMKHNKGKYWYLDEEFQEKKVDQIETEEVGMDEAAQMQAKYTSQPYTGLHQVKKFAAEDDLVNKQKQEIMEQVLVDQLSRHVLSDAEQDRDPARQNPADPTSNFNTAPLRFRTRRLHETKVSTQGAATESTLKDRITFGARLITRGGRDALRELFGFYFHTDQTLTVYEFRQFGKNSHKALPLIDRGKYSHALGRRKGKAYGPEDFQLGRNLTFLTKNQHHLPDTLRQQMVLTMRICDASSSGAGRDWEESDRSGGSDTALERNDRKITNDVQRYIRQKLGDRSVSVVVGLGRLFRLLDDSGDGVLNKEELGRALEEFDISLPQKDFDAVWRVVDENNDGAIDYGEFMRAFIGEMNENRKLIVRKVFRKLDPHKSGKARLLDIQKLYSAKTHPMVVDGQFSKSEMEKQFMTTFSDLCAGSEVTFTEFEEYYEGLSIVMKRDEDFINMMRNCWGV